ncbi:MAG TPA: hypothetical protein VIW72_07735 [Burkholderiales bacterium]
MKRKNWSIVLKLICLLLVGRAAHADIGNGQIYVAFDRGQDTCGQFIEARRFNQQESATYAIWLAGYITAYNHFKPDTSDLLNSSNPNPAPMAGPIAWIKRYCLDHPMSSFIQAVDQFTDMQYPNRRK